MLQWPQILRKVYDVQIGGSRGLMVRELDLKSKGCGFESQVRQGLLVGRVINQHSLHPQYHYWGVLEQGTEPPIAPRALEQWLPTALGVCSQCVCSLLCVCVCALGWVKCRAPISSMGHHTWQFITLLLLNSKLETDFLIKIFTV